MQHSLSGRHYCLCIVHLVCSFFAPVRCSADSGRTLLSGDGMYVSISAIVRFRDMKMSDVTTEFLTSLCNITTQRTMAAVSKGEPRELWVPSTCNTTAREGSVITNSTVSLPSSITADDLQSATTSLLSGVAADIAASELLSSFGSIDAVQVSSSDSAAAGSSVVYPIISKSKALLAPEEALTFKGQTLNLIVTFAQDNGSGSRIAVTLPGFLPNHVEVKISAPGVSSSLMPMKSIRRLSSDAYSLVIAPYEDTWPKAAMNPCTSLNVRIAISGNDLMDQAPEGASINNSNVAVVDWMYASSTINCDSESKQGNTATLVMVILLASLIGLYGVSAMISRSCNTGQQLPPPSPMLARGSMQNSPFSPTYATTHEISEQFDTIALAGDARQPSTQQSSGAVNDPTDTLGLSLPKPDAAHYTMHTNPAVGIGTPRQDANSPNSLPPVLTIRNNYLMDSSFQSAESQSDPITPAT